MMLIGGKVCAVFGGSRGIGKAVCELLATHGGTVAVLGRDASKAAETASLLPLEGSSSREHKSFRCDVRDPACVIRSVEEVQKTLGSIDILVNSAGINKDALLLRTKVTDLHNLTSTNLFGSIYTSQAVLKSMLQRKRGCIINIGSIVGMKGNAGQTVYSASKAGLVGLTRSLAKEVASRGVRVNLIAPGLIATDMTSAMRGKDSAFAKSIPMQRYGDPSEVAEAVRFLIESPYITGQVLAVDGGLQLMM